MKKYKQIWIIGNNNSFSEKASSKHFSKSCLYPTSPQKKLTSKCDSQSFCIEPQLNSAVQQERRQNGEEKLRSNVIKSQSIQKAESDEKELKSKIFKKKNQSEQSYFSQKENLNGNVVRARMDKRYEFSSEENSSMLREIEILKALIQQKQEDKNYFKEKLDEERSWFQSRIFEQDIEIENLQQEISFLTRDIEQYQKSLIKQSCINEKKGDETKNKTMIEEGIQTELSWETIEFIVEEKIIKFSLQKEEEINQIKEFYERQIDSLKQLYEGQIQVLKNMCFQPQQQQNNIISYNSIEIKEIQETLPDELEESFEIQPIFDQKQNQSWNNLKEELDHVSTEGQPQKSKEKKKWVKIMIFVIGFLFGGLTGKVIQRLKRIIL